MPSATRTQRARSYTFTLNNPKDVTELDSLKQLPVKYIIVGNELSKTGTPHYQGYITFNNPTSFNTIKKAIPTAHIEVAKGTAQQNREYCSKESILLEVGSIGVPGKRNDLSEVRDTLDKSHRIRDIINTATSNQQIKYAYEYLKFSEPPRPIGKIEVHWYYGNSGTGKSRLAREENEDVFIPYDYSHWEGYDGNKVVLLDDFRKNFCTFNELLKLTDIYPLRVRCLYGTRQLQATKIIINTLYSPLDTYNTREDIYQLTRRITTCKKFHQNGQIENINLNETI